MEESQRKRKAMVFLSLLLFQMCCPERIIEMGQQHYKLNIRPNADSPESNELVNREKRSFVGWVVPSFVAVTASFAILLNCRILTPDLAANVQKVKVLQRNINEHKRLINLKKNKVNSINRQLDRLNSSLKIIAEQMDLFTTIEEEIIVLLDPKIRKKLIEEETRLSDYYRKTRIEIIDLQLVQVKFVDLIDFATETSILTSAIVSIYWTSMKLAHLLSADFAMAETTRWLRSKPDLFKTKSFKFEPISAKNVRYKYIMTSAKLPGPQVFQKISSFRSQSLLKQHIKLKLRTGFVVLFSAFLFAKQFAVFVKHAVNCNKANIRAIKVIAKLKKARKSMALIEKEFGILERMSTKKFHSMAVVLTTSGFYTYVKQAYKIAKSQSKTSERMKDASEKLLYFKIHMRLLVRHTKSLNFKAIASTVEKLEEGMKIVNSEFTCTKNKIQLVRQSVDQCERGVSNSKIMNKVNSTITKSSKDCQYNSLDIKIALRVSMSKVNKSPVCIRNNLIIQKIVCKNLIKGLNDFENAKSIDDVSVSDVMHMKHFCNGKNVDKETARSICNGKLHDKTLKEVIKENIFYNKSQVMLIYDACKLTKRQNRYICELKKSRKGEDFVKMKFSNYPVSAVQDSYNKCVPDINPAAASTICMFSNYMKTKYPNHPSLKRYTKLYGYKSILNVLQRCSAIL